MSYSTSMIHAVLTAFLNCSIVLMPLLFLARRYRARDAFTAAALTILLTLTDEILLDLPRDYFAFHWNWIGKLLESIWPVAAAFIFRVPVRFTAFRLPEKKSAYLAALICGVVLALFNIPYFLQGQFVSAKNSDLQSILFQCTMPGLGEEIFYRGLLLAALDRWLSRPWTFAGVKIGFGIFISSGIFIAAHLIEITENYHLNLCPDPYYYVFVTVVAFSLGYLRYKTKSVVPCILAHNILNGLRYIVSAIANNL